MVEALIRFAGTDMLPGRGLYKDEVAIPNVFTYVAESAEDLPDRREISRRTLVIKVSFIDDKISKGAILDEVRANAKGMIKYLKRLVETYPPEWYRQQTDTGSRPVVPVALAKLFGAVLPAVEGEDLSDVFDSMAEFVASPEATKHGEGELEKLKLRRAGKVSLEAKTLLSYSLAYFIDKMLERAGKSELFSPYAKKSKELINRIQRETEYRVEHAQNGYMSVEARGKKYALRIEDGRRFIFCLELDYLTRMAAARAAASAAAAPQGAPVAQIPVPAPGPVPTVPVVGAPVTSPTTSTFQAPSASLLTSSTKKAGP